MACSHRETERIFRQRGCPPPHVAQQMRGTMTPPAAKSPTALRATAYHEAGHAVAEHALGLTVNKVSIIPGEGFNGVCRSPGALGYHFANGRERRAIGR